MKTIIRISLELIIISILVVFLNDAFSQAKRVTSPPKSAPTNVDLIGVLKSGAMAKDLQMVPFNAMYDYLSKSGYTSGNNYFPIVGYDPNIKKLIPLTATLKYPISKNPMPAEDLALIMVAYRDSVSRANDDLEERVTRLENKVAQIERDCCSERK